ncbi:MAG: hypothetical protein LBU04_02175 [Christensenellaceae bacterium]|jgi:hypothetical protein|nr:hypothetical protein [Christensenellaceae bacterium]
MFSFDCISCLKYEGYVPSYDTTELTEKLHEQFGFRTDCEIITYKELINIKNETKLKKVFRKNYKFELQGKERK